MKNTRFTVVTLLLGLSGWTYWSFSGRPVAAATEPLRVPDVQPVGARYRDLAIACLTMGSLTPSMEDLGPEEFDSFVEPIARVLEMHMEADFDAYLQAHLPDLVWANAERSMDVGALSAMLATDFNLANDAAPTQWIGGLRLFWSLMYPEPVLVGLDPASCRLDYHVMHFDNQAGEPDLTEYEKSFEDRRASFPVRMNSAMALPHRRTPEELARQQASLTWFDFQVGVTLGRNDQYSGGILLRYVWDSLDGGWFLVRAVTIYPDHFDLRSSRCVLLF